MDNLESQTYEVFEKDPIKYSQYQQVRTQVQMLIFIWCNKHVEISWKSIFIDCKVGVLFFRMDSNKNMFVSLFWTAIQKHQPFIHRL